MRRHIIPTLAAFAAASCLAASPAVAADAEDLATSPTVMVKASSPEQAEQIAAEHGLTVKRGFAWINWYELATPDGTTSAAAAQQALQDDPDVLGTDVVAPGERLGYAFQPRDAIWDAGPLPTGEQAPWYYTKANFPAAWDTSKGTGALIGIVDSEFAISHPELSPKVRDPYNTSAGTRNYHTGDVAAEGTDSTSVLHGTHVAGLAAAVTDNGSGVSGTGFDANFVPVRVKTSFETGSGNPVDAAFVADLTEALGYLKSKNISVVNMSLGGTRSHPPLADAIAALRATGVTIVAAAGNFQQTNPNAPIYPASYPGVIAVANTQSNDSINPTSSNGSWVDIAAPGTNLLSTWDPRDTSSGWTAGYNAITGTSMAAPVVTGLVALMKSARPDLSPDEVEMILKGTARDLGSAGADPQFGAGLIDANAAVSAAVAYVRPLPPTPEPTPVPLPPGPPADTFAPALKLRGAFELKGKRALTVRFLCNEACSGTLRVYAAKGKKKKGKRYASKKFTGFANKRITVKLNSSVKLKKKANVVVQIQVKDILGNTMTQEFRKKLK